MSETLDTPLPGEAIPILRKIVGHIVSKRYDAIESDGCLGRVTAVEIKRVVDEMSEGTLVDVPEKVWNTVPALYAYPFHGNDAEGWMVDIPMWTEEYGQSDLTLTVLVTQATSGYTAGISDFHIL